MKITRKFLQVGAVIESVAKPFPGIQYTITEINPPFGFYSTYTTYRMEGILEGKPAYRSHLTLNHLQRYFKAIRPAPITT